MAGYSDPGFDTLALHAGAAPDPATGARAVPIHLTTSFVFDSSEQAASLFNLERSGHVYSRISNPTTAVLEERIAALEGGCGAIATASGQAALHLAIATLAGAGHHVVASSALYGGSHNLLDYTLRRFGIATTFVPPGDIDAWRAAIRPETRLLFGETLGNPGLDVLDLPNIGGLAHEHHLPLLVDSTFTPPWLLKPFDHGADLVFHSATKFLSGHGTVVGGLLVDSGAFDWDAAHAASGRFGELSSAYDGFHGMVFTEESTVGAFLLRARREGLRDFGACMSPHTAWLILQGIETLPLRMARHVENTRQVVAMLAAHPMVARVGYPELESHPSHALAKQLLPRGCGAVFSFDLKGSRAQGQAFIEALKIFSHLANVGDCRSLVIHPASTTHFRMDDAALARAGIGPGTIRLSIGLEDAADLIDDLKRALKAAGESGMNLQVNGRTAYVYTGGKPFDARLPSVAFVHGALHDHSAWNLLARWCAHHGHNALAVDLPGHGRSAGPVLPSIEATADWLLALLQAAGVAEGLPLAVVGHSMGSLIALEAAARAPQRVTRLVMVGTAFPMKVSAALLDTAAQAPLKAIDMVNAFSISSLAAKPSYPGPGMWLHGSNRALMRRTLNGANATGCAVNLFHHDFSVCDAYAHGLQAAAAVQCPCTMVLGRQDQMTPPKATREIAAALKARVVVLDSGHSQMAEDPDGMLAALRGALA